MYCYTGITSAKKNPSAEIRVAYMLECKWVISSTFTPADMSWFRISLLDCVAILSTFSFLSYFIFGVRRRSVRAQPPGPPGYPLLGSLSTPAEPAWLVYRDWSKQYGKSIWAVPQDSSYASTCLGSDIVRLNVLGTNIIILNSFKSAIDLLDRRSNIYSDRYVIF